MSMGCFVRFTTAITLITGTQLTFAGMAQARFEPEHKADANICQVTSGYLQEVTCPFRQGEELPPNTEGGGGAR